MCYTNIYTDRHIRTHTHAHMHAYTHTTLVIHDIKKNIYPFKNPGGLLLPILGIILVHCIPYVGVGQVNNGILYLRYRSNFPITKEEFTCKTLHYSIVESAPRLPLFFSMLQKLPLKISVLLLFFFLSSLFIAHNSGVYKRSLHSMNAILSKIFQLLYD